MPSAPVPPAVDYDAYVFDIDGTVCLGDSLIAPAARTISELKRHGRTVAFMTNDATHNVEQHADRLTRLGVPTAPSEVITPIEAAVGVLGVRRAPAPVFTIGAACLSDACAEAGYPPTDDPYAACAVIVSHDHHFTYAKLNIALHALRNGAALLATNADAFRPTSAGGEPGTGAILAAVERAAGATAEIVGKPSVHMLEALRQVIGQARTCLIVGDQLDTDIRLAIEAGVDSALVMTGTTDESMLAASATIPTHVISTLDELLTLGTSPQRCTTA